MTTQIVEEINCLHHSDVVSTFEGSTETCRHCEQTVFIEHFKQPVVVKRGYIGGVMTKQHPDGNHDNATEATAIAETEEPGLEEQPASLEIPPAKTMEFPKNKSESWFDEHKEAILADYYSLVNIRTFLAKWHTSTKTWGELKKRWQVKSKRLISANAKGAAAPAHSPSASTIKRESVPPFPPFPAFNDSWMPTVQIAWLETWKEISSRRKT